MDSPRSIAPAFRTARRHAPLWAAVLLAGLGLVACVAPAWGSELDRSSRCGACAFYLALAVSLRVAGGRR